MARKPKSDRNKRRNEQRRKRNAEAKKRALNAAAEPPILKRARHITQLELLLSRGNITDKQYEVGDRIYKDWRRAGGQPRMVGAYDGDHVRCADGGYALHQVAARFRFERAMQHVSVAHRDVIIHVCLLDLRLDQWGDSRVGALLLREGLGELIRWYDSPSRNSGLDEAKSEMLVVV